MAYVKGRLEQLARIVDRHLAQDPAEALERLGGQLGLSADELGAVEARVQRLRDRRFSMPVSAHGATGRGGRSQNEDAFLVERKLRLFAVADGMGGYRGGATAAAAALRGLRDAVAGGRVDLEQAVLAANEVVLETAARAGYHKAGSTIVTLWLADDEVRLAWVGDSRCYRYDGARLAPLTRDHRLFGHVLEQALGREHVVPESVVERATPATYLLCSDGVTDVLGEGELLQHLRVGPKRLAGAAAAIVDAATRAGTRDNATALVVRVG